MQSEPALLWTVFAAAGLAITVVGWTDLLLLWYPLRFGDPEWEFGTISAHFNAMPLPTVGLVLLSAGVMGRGWRRATQMLSTFALLLVVALVGIFVFYLLDVPLAWKTAAPQIKPALKRAIVKAGAFAATYTLLYAWLAWFLWRCARLVKP